MSKIGRYFLAAAGLLWCFCAIAPAARGEDELWQTDFEAAKAKAKAEKKLLLVDFTGSDWCIWCKRLHGEVFDKDEFKTEAPKHFILVNSISREAKELPEDLKAQNDKLAKEYKIRGYPTILLLDPEGQLVAQTGYQPGGPEKYNKHLGVFVDAYADVVKIKDKLDKAKGLVRAKLLDQLVDLYVGQLQNDGDQTTGWSKEIVKLDAVNKAHLRGKHEFRLSMAEVNQLLANYKIADASAKLDKALKIKGVSDEQKSAAQDEIDNVKQVVKLQAQADKAKHVERAEALDKLVDATRKLMPLISTQAAMLAASRDMQASTEEIVQLDPDNKAGLKTKYGFQVTVMKAAKAAQNGDFDKARAALDEAEALPDLKDQQKAMIKRFRDQLPKADKDKASSKAKDKGKDKSDDEN